MKDCVVSSVQTIPWSDVDDDLKRQCAELWLLVWPDGHDVDIAARIERMNATYGELDDHRWHVALEGDALVAVARTFRHTVSVIDAAGVATDREVIALASVCSQPQRRGEGWGALVVDAALERTRTDQLPALFQTSVPEFYERVGSRHVRPESIFTSAPNADAFGDDFAMIHPGDAPWDDEATIDLRRSGW